MMSHTGDKNHAILPSTAGSHQPWRGLISSNFTPRTSKFSTQQGKLVSRGKMAERRVINGEEVEEEGAQVRPQRRPPLTCCRPLSSASKYSSSDSSSVRPPSSVSSKSKTPAIIYIEGPVCDHKTSGTGARDRPERPDGRTYKMTASPHAISGIPSDVMVTCFRRETSQSQPVEYSSRKYVIDHKSIYIRVSLS